MARSTTNNNSSDISDLSENSAVMPITVSNATTPPIAFDDHGGVSGRHGADDILPDGQGGIILATAQGADQRQEHAGLARLFDTKTGGHFFTASAKELAELQAQRPDLKSEGFGFATDDATAAGTSGVYRFFSAHDGGHFFTANANERDDLLARRPDLVFEGTAFHEQAGPKDGYSAVYRFFDKNDGGHLFTSSPAERDTLIATRSDLVNEGIAFYAPGK